ncbi:MAG: hypothetical protein JGK17_30740 [Microcoleus sp. PH2017_10_PVI_O_A]|uniref:hypothetical protein n=1 Tax=unclassified Microcoleus TaxID=2642155 RepID=UPI001D9E699B|nr:MULTISPECIES: hypothetical protein [unclassified Microcoleus]TAE73858.1 MAG: hypothetical protein EAZ83_31095 [Oscillatoriales cyanobacterium]MCC3409842.1 hypothetical protein [Microcoleus sp. PH2017_10_PVI_O_A]MCC3464125.1 hypothetical protein [Microcoleus sp. PH2017_11_PCY_U_A]MCC3482451.1 hypothetical protein [Microcoleus sp. PH2017_12_PCY_D_A]MCC3532013.1 hypothetical protein [Microcoleus sp. PH2017_21_RUC_O_A]
MKTPSHAIINLAILGRVQHSEFNLLIVTGGILPDIPIFLFYFWAKYIARLPEAKIWSEAYYEPLNQNIVALFHSIPLAAIGWLIAYYLGLQNVQILFLSIILHSLGDLPVHNDDAHRHFFPFSNYRFISPISYWDPNHYGSIVSLVEMLLVLLSTFRVLGFVNSYVGKVLLILVNSFYSIGSVSFYVRSK